MINLTKAKVEDSHVRRGDPVYHQGKRFTVKGIYRFRFLGKMEFLALDPEDGGGVIHRFSHELGVRK